MDKRLMPLIELSGYSVLNGLVLTDFTALTITTVLIL